MDGERHLDLTSEPPEPYPAQCKQGRPFLGIHFACCRVYARIYRNAQGDAYVGHCPRCGRPVRVKISPTGTQARFFEAR